MAGEGERAANERRGTLQFSTGAGSLFVVLTNCLVFKIRGQDQRHRPQLREAGVLNFSPLLFESLPVSSWAAIN